MKRRRVKADYGVDFHKLPEKLKEANANTEECIALLSSIPENLSVDLPRRYSF